MERIFLLEDDDTLGRGIAMALSGPDRAVTQADCPDQYCVHQGFRSSGTPIVCLPHELIIEFVSDPGLEGAGADGVDGVVGVVHKPAAAAADHICVFIPAPFMEDPAHSKSPPSKMRILSAP